MTRRATVLTSVQRMYDAALTADIWQPALQSIVLLLGGDHATLFAREPAREGTVVATCAGMEERDFNPPRSALPSLRGSLQFRGEQLLDFPWRPVLGRTDLQAGNSRRAETGRP